MWERQLLEKVFKNSCILKYPRWSSALHIYFIPMREKNTMTYGGMYLKNRYISFLLEREDNYHEKIIYSRICDRRSSGQGV